MKWQIAVAALLLAGVAQAATSSSSSPSGDGVVVVQDPAQPSQRIPQYVTGYSVGENQRIAEEGRSAAAPSASGTGSASEANGRGFVPAHE